MTAILKLKRTYTASRVFTTGELAEGELGVNITDKKIYIRDNSNNIVLLNASGGGGGSPIVVKKDYSVVTSSLTGLNFVGDFSVTNTGGDVNVNMTVNDRVLTADAGQVSGYVNIGTAYGVKLPQYGGNGSIQATLASGATSNARFYYLPDKDITIAGTSDIPAEHGNSGLINLNSSGGNNQATAYQIAKGDNHNFVNFATQGTFDSLKMPTNDPNLRKGTEYTVINGTLAILKLYPYSGERFDNRVADDFIFVHPGSSVRLVAATNTRWITSDSISLPKTGIYNKAAAGNNQATATPLDIGSTYVSSATAGTAEGYLLPQTSRYAVGTRVIVTNASGVTVKVYPYAGEYILGMSGNVPVTLVNGTQYIFELAVNGTWLCTSSLVTKLGSTVIEDNTRNITLTGSAVASAVADGVGGVTYTINSSGASPTSVTLDFGTKWMQSKSFTFADAAATTGKKIAIFVDPDSDEYEMDGLTCSAYVSSNGNITAFVSSPNFVAGTRKFFYTIN